jgi:lipopolysaccharide export system ATP-binding protein
MPNLLEVDSVIKSYKGIHVLSDVYMKCETGDILGLLGRNGSGKSTLLKIIFGILDAENRFIRIDGKPHHQPYKTINEICYLPQHDFLPKYLSAEKAIGLYLDKNKVGSFFEDQLISDLKKAKVADLSGGELRYLEIKMLLFTDCKFVLLDEPFNGISPILKESIKEIISQQSHSKGIILTDHDYRNVLDIANRYCMLYDGSIKEVHDRNDLIKWGYLSDK